MVSHLDVSSSYLQVTIRRQSWPVRALSKPNQRFRVPSDLESSKTGLDLQLGILILDRSINAALQDVE